MNKVFQIQNVKCKGCANTVKMKLKESFGEVEIDLSKDPRTISLNIEEKDIPALRKKLVSLGYPMVDENLSGIDNIKTKAKSFVSCAVGRINLNQDKDK